MNHPAGGQARWDDPVYDRIASARCGDDRQCTVTFANGDRVQFDIAALLPPSTDFDDIDWWRAAANEMELIVPIGNEWFEIPYDVIRRHTDPEYEAFWVELTKRGMEQLGIRLRALREERRLSLEAVASRSGLTLDTLRALETGEADPWLDHRPVLAAMGYPADALDTPIEPAAAPTRSGG